MQLEPQRCCPFLDNQLISPSWPVWSGHWDAVSEPKAGLCGTAVVDLVDAVVPAVVDDDSPRNGRLERRQ